MSLRTFEFIPRLIYGQKYIQLSQNDTFFSLVTSECTQITSRLASSNLTTCSKRRYKTFCYYFPFRGSDIAKRGEKTPKTGIVTFTPPQKITRYPKIDLRHFKKWHHFGWGQFMLKVRAIYTLRPLCTYDEGIEYSESNLYSSQRAFNSLRAIYTKKWGHCLLKWGHFLQDTNLTVTLRRTKCFHSLMKEGTLQN